MKRNRKFEDHLLGAILYSIIIFGIVFSSYIGFSLAFPNDRTTDTAYSRGVEGMGE